MTRTETGQSYGRRRPRVEGSRRRAKRRRGLRWRRAALLAGILVVVSVAAVLGAAWYGAGRLIAVTHVQDRYPLRVVAVNAAAGTVALGRGPDATEPGTFRLSWPHGQAVVGAVLSTGQATVTRRLSDVRGSLMAGQHVGVQADTYVGDPHSALGLNFSTVAVPTPLGAMPAWWVPGRRRTWVVLVHGLGGSRSDTLPAMPTLHDLGYPILAVSYRNDLGVPPNPDHRSHLGATEWRDIEAAVSYAVNHRASGVVLYGYSLGGAMALRVAQASPLRNDISAVILDSPVLDWRATLNYAARRHNLPGPLATLGQQLLGWRIHLDYAEFDQLAHERDLRTPTLLIQGSADTV